MLERNVKAFDADVSTNQGYLYTNTTKLSSFLSNQRISKEIIQGLDVADKTILDVGCGDGTYTLELLASRPCKVVGFDASQSGIEVALVNKSQLALELQPKIDFIHADIYQFVPQEYFDVVVVRGLIHHLYEPEQAIAQISRWGKEIIVVEPNGYNPVLKLIEKLSSYHRQHEEKSYCPHTLKRWFQQQGTEIVEESYIGLVPFFCPEALAKVLKKMEPWVESIPLLRNFACGQFVFKAKVLNTTSG